MKNNYLLQRWLVLMKKKQNLFRFLVLAVVIIVANCALFYPRENNDNIPALLPETIVIEKNGILISVNPAMELLAVIQSLSDYRNLGLITRYDLEYKRDVNAYFSGSARHRAVSFTNRYMGRGFAFDAPPAAALMINHDFTLDSTAFAASHRLQGIDINIHDFISVMKSFYLDSDFEAFYLDQAGYYNSILEMTAKSFPDWDMISVMESFYGKNFESYNLVLSSLFHSGGYGPSIMRDNGIAAYSVQGPLDITGDGMPVFGDTESFTMLALHEFGHPFVPIYEAYIEDMPDIRKALEDSAYLMEPIRERMAANAYRSWNTICEELIVRAVVIRMLSDNQGMDVAELKRREYDRGFIYIETVYDILQKYIDDRESYPVFDDFIPVLISELMQAHP
jgi:hypothetical protein